MLQSNQDKSETNESVDSFFKSTTTTDYREVLFSKTDNVFETLFLNTDNRIDLRWVLHFSLIFLTGLSTPAMACLCCRAACCMAGTTAPQGGGTSQNFRLRNCSSLPP